MNSLHEAILEVLGPLKHYSGYIIFYLKKQTKTTHLRNSISPFLGFTYFLVMICYTHHFFLGMYTKSNVFSHAVKVTRALTTAQTEWLGLGFFKLQKLYEISLFFCL